MLQLLTGSNHASSVIQVEAALKAPSIEKFAAVLDPRAGGWPPAEAASFADLAMKCVEMRRQDRPDLRCLPSKCLSSVSSALIHPRCSL